MGCSSWRSPESAPAPGTSTASTASATGPTRRPGHQPEGVHGPSVVVDGAGAAWTDQAFRGHALARPRVLRAARRHLHGGRDLRGGHPAPAPAGRARDHRDRADAGRRVPGLAQLGLRRRPPVRAAVHLWRTARPPAPGRRRPTARGLSVVLDVVYNHLGPEGNYLGEYGPYYTDRYKTPWGTAINFDGPDSEGVRRHFVENARYWVREFHVDGLRLDAIHSIFDHEPGPHPDRAGRGGPRRRPARSSRPVHIIAESHDNDRRIVLPPRKAASAWTPSGPTTSTTPSTAGSPARSGGYYVDFADGKGLGRAHGRRVRLPGRAVGVLRSSAWHRRAPISAGERFVLCLQNHDQVGNRAQGDRLVDHRADGRGEDGRRAAVRRAGAAAALHGRGVRRDLAVSVLHLVSRSRRSSRPCAWAAPPSSAASAGRPRRRIPARSATFLRSRLNHSLAGAPRHRELREYYRHWLALRRTHPALGARGKERARCEVDASGSVLTLTREAPDGDARLPGRQPHQHRAALRAAVAATGGTCSTARIRASRGGGMGRPLAPYQCRPLRSQPAGVIAS